MWPLIWSYWGEWKVDEDSDTKKKTSYSDVHSMIDVLMQFG